MSGEQPPPPGWGAPPTPPPAWGTPPPGVGGPAWGGGGPAYVPTAPQPAHKPGAIPLRPLTLGDFFDGAFRIIRYNPQATIGAAVLVSAVAMVVPVVTSLVTGSTGSLRFDPAAGGITHSQVLGLVSAFGSLLVGVQLQSIGLLYVSGMVAHVASAAAVGRKLSIGEAWAATRGKRWRLLGLALLLGLAVLVVVGAAAGLVVVVAVNASVGTTVLVGVAAGLLTVVAYVVFWVRVRSVSVPALMLEPVGILGALGRAVRLTRRQFWRMFGILLLTSLVVGVAGSMLRLPFSMAGELFLVGRPDSSYGVSLYVLLTAVGTVLSSAVVQPFSAAVSALLYVDQRMRKEAYDVDLLQRAGIVPA